jgi:hypothetical protein
VSTFGVFGNETSGLLTEIWARRDWDERCSVSRFTALYGGGGTYLLTLPFAASLPALLELSSFSTLGRDM